MSYSLILIPILVGIITQIIKVIVLIIKKRKFKLNYITTYGEMPSSHASLIVSIVLIVGLEEQFDSAIFALGFIIMMLILRDAVGLRNQIEYQNQAFLKLLEKLPASEKDDIKLPAYQVGHTFWEVSAGFIIGIILTLIFYSFI